MYGRGSASIAEQIGSTPEEAQKIVDDFYKGFPKVKTWVEKTEADCRKLGYVEDLWGRRRRLPDIQLPQYTIKLKGDKGSINFNPILGCLGKVDKQDNPLIKKYQEKLSQMKYRKEYEKIKTEADKEGVTIINNGSFISQAERQCVNARIQGGAATLTKMAMIDIYKDKVLKDLGFSMLLAVHDELIGECPIENKDLVAERLCQLMIDAAKRDIEVPFKCDPTIEDHWYYTDYTDVLREHFEDDVKSGMSREEAYNKLVSEHPECFDEWLQDITR